MSKQELRLELQIFRTDTAWEISAAPDITAKSTQCKTTELNRTAAEKYMNMHGNSVNPNSPSGGQRDQQTTQNITLMETQNIQGKEV